MTVKNKGDDLEMKIKDVKILTIDIETSPIIGYTWGGKHGKYEADILDFVEYGKVISYSAKWLNGKQETKALCDYKGYKPNKVDDSKIIKDIHKLLDQADIVIGQNSIAFDTKYINTRFLAHGLTPPSPYKQVDTKVEAKKIARFPSNKLDDLGKYLNLGRKEEHEGFDLWLKCIAGDSKAWKKMKSYNAQDVKLTEKVYLKLLPFMKTHPNLTLYTEKIGCPKCESVHVENRGYYTLTSGKYHKAHCLNCGSWYRYGKAIPLANKNTKGTII